MCQAAQGQVTGLVSIPVADNIGFRELELGYGTGANEFDKRYGHGAYVLAGVHERVEIAASTGFMGDHAWGFKVVPFRSADDKFALGIGAQNISGSSSDMFAMGRYSLGAVNLHLGWMEDTTDRLCLGMDMACCCDKLTLGLDHTTGAGGATWLGAWYDIGQGFTFNVSAGYPNARADGIQHSFNLTYGTRF